jgi:hypothetical protein
MMSWVEMLLNFKVRVTNKVGSDILFNGWPKRWPEHDEPCSREKLEH